MNDNEYQGYSHYFKYNPDGIGTGFHDSYMAAILINHMISNSLFYELKFSHLENEYQSYLFEDLKICSKIQ